MYDNQQIKDLLHQKFGRLLVVELVDNNGRKGAYWKCVCDCGNNVVVSSRGLTAGWKKSCGCLHRESAIAINAKYLTTHKQSQNIIGRMFYAARTRAKKKNLEFNIDIADIKIPKKCPLLNIELNTHNVKTLYNSPSLDRIDSSKGYVKGNIWIVSFRANTIKSNATARELKYIAKNLEIKQNKYH